MPQVRRQRLREPSVVPVFLRVSSDAGLDGDLDDVCTSSCPVENLVDVLANMLDLLDPELYKTSDVLPRFLHALRVGVSSLNDAQDSEMLLADLKESLFKGDLDLSTIVKAQK